MLIAVLAVAAFSIRVLGLVAGDAIRSSRYSWILDDLPGLIVVSLVASSLAGQSIGTWVAAAVALFVAYLTNHVIWTMCIGVAAYALLVWFGA
ncbi:AzlD domain-containing protein [uncultured Roseobacter sp.]|uniref:AzlD domain-containing protein n=1 Tax=uncultured Roseobacter sp. TaxID=114847 RepID=UPI00260B7FE5|nr:AzlD domain-containing protein [uncultured Roseobacter sp.]